MIALLPSNSARVIQRVRGELHAKCPFCFWCGILTYEYHPAEIQGKRMPWNKATIDHLGKRSRPFPQPVVLACNECNTFRAMLKWLKQNHRGKKAMREFEKFKERLIQRSIYLEIKGE